MRLMVIGTLDGQLTAAARIAVDNGAPVRHADRIETALAMLHVGPAPDLMIVDVAIDIRHLAARLRLAGVSAPVVACGTSSEDGAAIHAGAREYPEMIAAILAAVADDGRETAPPQAGEDFGDNRRAQECVKDFGLPESDSLSPQRGERDGAAASGNAEFFTSSKASLDIPLVLAGRDDATARTAHATSAAETVTRSLVGRTVADVERDLILETLRRCLGNRTHAASILGISLRTLRNKLTVYAAEGASVPPPNNGEIRGAA